MAPQSQTRRRRRGPCSQAAPPDTLGGLFPGQRSIFDARTRRGLGRIADGTGEGPGAGGRAFVDGQILRARAEDGASDISTPTYVASSGPQGLHAADIASEPGGLWAETGGESPRSP